MRWYLLLAGILVGAWGQMWAGAAETDTTRVEDRCRVDKDCSGYLRCLKRVCATPPAVLGHADAQTPTVELVADGSWRGRFFVELATDDFERGRGLSYRPSMALGWGMFFIFPRPVRNLFTMAQMRFPLDILFIEKGGKVVDIIENAQPQTRVLRPSAAYQYALELNAGTVRAHAIQVGDLMTLTGLPPRYLPDNGR